MADDAFSFYCQNRSNLGSTCALDDLIVVKTLVETFDENGECTEHAVIYKCAVCGGFYKRQYRAIYYSCFEFDTDEGWSITDDYYKIEQPLWRGIGSSGKPPLPLEEARFYGYTGKDHTWKNNRCNFPPESGELTCRGADVKLVAYRSPESGTQTSDKFYKCMRCGEWYFYTAVAPYTRTTLKSSSGLFPIDEAKKFGYDETEFIMKKDFEALDSDFKTWEEPPRLDEWLKAERSEKENAEYAFLILKKHFAINGLKVKERETPFSWTSFSWDLYLNIDKFVSEGSHQAMLTNLLFELTDFCEAATGEFFAYTLKILFEKFINQDPPRSRFTPLLPTKALAAFDEMNRMLDDDHERYLEILNQQGY